MNPNELVTWPILGTYAGAAGMTALIVQATKGWLDRVLHIPTQLYSYLVALAVLYSSYFFTCRLNMPSAVLILFNGLVVSTASNGVYHVASRMTQAAREKTKGGDDKKGE